MPWKCPFCDHISGTLNGLRKHFKMTHYDGSYCHICGRSGFKDVTIHAIKQGDEEHLAYAFLTAQPRCKQGRHIEVRKAVEKLYWVDEEVVKLEELFSSPDYKLLESGECDGVEYHVYWVNNRKSIVVKCPRCGQYGFLQSKNKVRNGRKFIIRHKSRTCTFGVFSDHNETLTEIYRRVREKRVLAVLSSNEG